MQGTTFLQTIKWYHQTLFKQNHKYVFEILIIQELA